MIPEQGCGFYLKQLNDTLEKNANNALRSEDMTMAQSGALLYLNSLPKGEAPLKQLEKRMKVAQSTAAGIICRLEQKGFIESFGSNEDRRIKIVRITSSGREICGKSFEHMENTEQVLLRDFTDVEKMMFIQLLKKACENCK